MAVAEPAERRGRPAGRPVHGAGRAVGRARRRWFRRGVADGGMGAQPGGVGDRAGQQGAGRRASRPCCRTTDPQDVVGSPYCVRDYEVDPHLGGRDGLARARAALARHGLGLILDFVPNHVAPDHPWTRTNPELFVHGTSQELEDDPGSFVAIDGSVLARGRDPYFPAWPDVVQLNAFAPALRDDRRRHPPRHRRTVRRGALRHGDADDERRLRPNLGGSGRRTPRRTTGRPSFPPCATRTPASASSPRPIGTSSGRCNSRASTSATTSASTTASRQARSGRSGPTCPRTGTISNGWSGSSRTTTSRGPPRRSTTVGNGPRR